MVSLYVDHYVDLYVDHYVDHCVDHYVDHCHHKLCISNTKEEKMRCSASDSSLESVETQGACVRTLCSVQY